MFIFTRSPLIFFKLLLLLIVIFLITTSKIAFCSNIKRIEEYGIIREFFICNVYSDLERYILFNSKSVSIPNFYKIDKKGLIAINIKLEVLSNYNPTQIKEIDIKGPDNLEIDIKSAVPFNNKDGYGHIISPQALWFIYTHSDNRLPNGKYSIKIRLESGHSQIVTKNLQDNDNLVSSYKKQQHSFFDYSPHGIIISEEKKINDPEFRWPQLPNLKAYYQLKIFKGLEEFSFFSDSINKDSIFKRTGVVPYPNINSKILYSDLTADQEYHWHLQIFDHKKTSEVNEIILTPLINTIWKENLHFLIE